MEYAISPILERSSLRLIRILVCVRWVVLLFVLSMIPTIRSAYAIERISVECSGPEESMNPLGQQIKRLWTVIFTLELRDAAEQRSRAPFVDSAGKKSKFGRYYALDVNMWTSITSATDSVLLLDDFEGDGTGTHNKIDRQSGDWTYLFVDKNKPEFYRRLAATSIRPKEQVDKEIREVKVTTVVHGSCKKVATKLPLGPAV